MRNRYHFSAKKGWINDPNGMIFAGGKYHLFYQYYPDDIKWGPMHWGHATSCNLSDWDEQETALFPDDLGMIFSGSAILDTENVSGFGSKEKPAMVLMYTSHDNEGPTEQQSIAYSTDYIHFEKYEGNPVIKNTPEMSGYKKDFRDPKIVKNTVIGGFTAVFASGDKIEFYHSDDLKNWEKTGEFLPGENGGFGELCECPDLFSLECDGKTYYVLLMSQAIDTSKRDDGHLKFFMQYFYGDFDGKTFTASEGCKKSGPLYPDFGPDNYAAVTFANMREAVMLGWAENWDYVNDTIATDYQGAMTLPRKVSLVETKEGKRLCFEVYVSDKTSLDVRKFSLNPGEKREVVAGKLSLEVTGDEIIVTRDKAFPAHVSGKLDEDAFHIFKSKRFIDGSSDVEVIVDEGLVEIFADGGLNVFTCRI
ncbi:MAG: glycoside hydrolase family 32 protein [Lachnospiraceae bacterium]|nr:glycoside hydrolase family 32 protein [Lachnospiraceae bacterium]